MEEQLSGLKYDFTQMLVGMEAFIGSFEKNVQEIYPNIPIMTLNTGDESFLFKKKFEKTNNNEIHLMVPRIVVDIDDTQIDVEQNTNPYIECQYVLNQKLYKAKFRRQAYNIPVVLNLVASNFIKAHEYFGMVNAILSIDNVFTYEFLGNTYEANYKLTSASWEKPDPAPGSTSKNYVIKLNIDLGLQILTVKYKTIKEVVSGEAKEWRFQINTREPDGSNTTTTYLKPNPGEECKACVVGPIVTGKN